jgi:hypothetical protein
LNKNVHKKISLFIDVPFSNYVCSLLKQKLFDTICQYLIIHVSAVVDINRLCTQGLNRETNIQMKQINGASSCTTEIHSGYDLVIKNFTGKAKV